MTKELRQDVIALVGKSPHTIAATLREIGVSKSSYYRWRQGSGNGNQRKGSWNALRDEERKAIVAHDLTQPHLPPRQLASRVWQVTNQRVHGTPGRSEPRTLGSTSRARNYESDSGRQLEEDRLQSSRGPDDDPISSLTQSLKLNCVGIVMCGHPWR